jgi:hypothetical protein
MREGRGCAKGEISGWVSWGLFFEYFLWTRQTKFIYTIKNNHPINKESIAVGRQAPQAYLIGYL